MKQWGSEAVKRTGLEEAGLHRINAWLAATTATVGHSGYALCG